MRATARLLRHSDEVFGAVKQRAQVGDAVLQAHDTFAIRAIQIGIADLLQIFGDRACDRLGRACGSLWPGAAGVASARTSSSMTGRRASRRFFSRSTSSMAKVGSTSASSIRNTGSDISCNALGAAAIRARGQGGRGTAEQKAAPAIW